MKVLLSDFRGGYFLSSLHVSGRICVYLLDFMAAEFKNAVQDLGSHESVYRLRRHENEVMRLGCRKIFAVSLNEITLWDWKQQALSDRKD